MSGNVFKIEDMPLIDANVIPAVVGERWPVAVAMLIEEHEKRYEGLAHRRSARVLMEGYTAKFFPAVTLGIPTRRVIQKMLHERYVERAQNLRNRIVMRYVRAGLKPFSSASSSS